MHETLLYGLTATHTRIHRCLADLTEEEALRSPMAGLAPIIWQAGHLAWADSNMAHRVDGSSAAPDGYTDLFKTGTGGEAAYPPLAEVKEILDWAQRSLEAAARTADPATSLEARNYSNVGEMLVFASYHRGYHIGKMTTLRALLKKPRLFG